eukprot:10489863-Prorocentrum_lima.AAC.1
MVKSIPIIGNELSEFVFSGRGGLLEQWRRNSTRPYDLPTMSGQNSLITRPSGAPSELWDL